MQLPPFLYGFFLCSPLAHFPIKMGRIAKNTGVPCPALVQKLDGGVCPLLYSPGCYVGLDNNHDLVTPL